MNDLLAARWRRVYSVEWHQGPFQRLSDQERVIYFYARTGPQSTSVGIYRMSTALAVEDLGSVTPVEFDSRLDAVCSAFGWRFDSGTRVLWMPAWIDENPPQSPNVCKSWRKLLANLPECDLKYEAEDAILRYLAERLVVRNREAFLEQFGKPFERTAGSLPKAFRKNGAQPKAQPKADQGAGDSGNQGSGSREQARSRARAVEKLAEISPAVIGLARQAVVFHNPSASLEELYDVMSSINLAKGNSQLIRSEAIAALNVAIAESRGAAR
jgi:hypothetical protein